MKDQELIEKLEARLAQGEQTPEILYSLGCAYGRLSRLEQARACFQQLTEKAPDSLEAQLAREQLEGLTQAPEDDPVTPLSPEELARKRTKRTCAFHPAREAAAACYRCQKWICEGCLASVEDGVLCPSCLQQEALRRRPKKREGLPRLYLTTALFSGPLALLPFWLLFLLLKGLVPEMFGRAPLPGGWRLLVLSAAAFGGVGILLSLIVGFVVELLDVRDARGGMAAGGATLAFLFFSLAFVVASGFGYWMVELGGPVFLLGLEVGFFYVFVRRIVTPARLISWQKGG